MHMELIPGIPDDVARECLVRVDYKQLPTVMSVCKSWKSEVELSEFRRLRKEASCSKGLVVLAQARVDPDWGSSLSKCRASPIYRLAVLEPGAGDWSELPPILIDGLGEFSLPMFCQMASVGSDLVVLGGLNPMTWEVSRAVFVFSFLTGKWRCGADMPDQQRSFFGCTSDSERLVFVAGGHDEEKNALRSAMAYDVERAEWIPLPDMVKERDECKAIFRGGKVHVIGGYCTEMQGSFERSAEVFNVDTWQWDHSQEDFLEAPTCPRRCVSGDDGDVYMCCGGDVVALKGSKWQVIARLPDDAANGAYMTAWQDKLLVIGSDQFGEPHVAYVLDLENPKWTRVATPEDFSGHVQSGCCLEI